MSDDPLPLWWVQVSETTAALAADLKVLVDQANEYGRRDGKQLPASLRTLASRLYVGRTKVGRLLRGELPEIVEEDLVLALVRECLRIRGLELSREEEQRWRHRVTAALTAVVLAREADVRLGAGTALPMPRSAAALAELAELDERTGLVVIDIDLTRLEPPRGRRGPLLAVGAVVVALALVAVGVQLSLRPDPRLFALMRASQPCAEEIPVTPELMSRSQVAASEPGPADADHPTREVELRFAEDPRHGRLVWAHLRKSTSTLDRVWLDWSYLDAPRGGEAEQWRQCGPFPVAEGRDTLAVKVIDDARRPRWFRACGQVPKEDRPAATERASWCTFDSSGWVHPRRHPAA